MTRSTRRTRKSVPLSTNAFTSTWEPYTNASAVSKQFATFLILFFNGIYSKLDYYYPQLFAKAPADPEKFKKIEEAFEFLNIFLGQTKYAAGDHVTVADITLVATVSSLEAAKFDFSKYTNVVRWYNACKTTVPGYKINQAGIEEFKKFF